MLILITLGMTLLRNHGLAIYAAGRFLRMNFALQHIIGFQLCMERMAPQFRASSAMFLESSANGIGIMSVSIIGYLTNSWVQYLYGTCITFVMALLIYLNMPRSYRWLFSKNFENEGRQTLKDFCNSAEYEYSDKMVDEILEREATLQAQLNLATRNILRFPAMRLILLKLSIAWIAACMIYYGILLDPAPGNVLLGNFIAGILSVISGPVMIILMNLGMTKRRTLLLILYSITASLILVMGLTRKFSNPTLSLVCASLAYGTIAGAFSVLYLITSELLPTVIRCSMFGLLSSIGRIGSITGSQILKLDTDEKPWISAAIFFGVTALASISIFFLPETRDHGLAQTLEEAEVRYRKKK